MKRRLLAISLLVPIFAVILTSGVRSQVKRPVEPDAPRSVPQLRAELATTLRQAYDGSFAEFRGGRSSPMMPLQLNAQLYNAELAISAPGVRVRSAGDYRDRARQIESIAKLNFDHGTGTRHEYLAASAARLRAEIEVESLRQAL